MNSIREWLTKRPLSELQDTGFRLMVDPPEKKSVRAGWAEKLAAAIEADPAAVAFCLEPGFLDDLESLAERQATDEILHVKERHAGSFLPMLEALRPFGLSMHNREGWWMLPEAYGLVQLNTAQRKQIVLYDRFYTMVDGYTLLYGVIEINDLLKQAKMTHGRRCDDMLDAWRSRIGLSGIMTDEHTLWLVCPAAENPLALIESRKDPKLQKIGYVPMTAAEAMTMSQSAQLGMEKNASRVASMLRRHGAEEREIDTAIGDMILYIRNRDMDGAIGAMAGVMHSIPTPEEIELTSRFVQTIPRWEFKGHSPADLANLFQPQPKRDDPCPCGSGRKYRNCCGRFQ